MPLQSLINTVTGRSKLVRLTDDIAYTCSKIVWQKTEPGINSMTESEACGYVRGKAGRTVRLQLNHVLRHKKVSPRIQNKLLKMTMDSLIEMIIQQRYRPRLATGNLNRAA